MLSVEETDRIIEMAWEDRTPFDAIKMQFNLSESEVIELMRNNLQRKSWKRWRARVQGRKTKHVAQRVEEVDRFKCTRQRVISSNRIDKRVNKKKPVNIYSQAFSSRLTEA